MSLYATTDELTPKAAEGERGEVAADCTQLTFFPALHESQHSEDFLELCRERQVILQELLDHEKVRQPITTVPSDDQTCENEALPTHVKVIAPFAIKSRSMLLSLCAQGRHANGTTRPASKCFKGTIKRINCYVNMF